MANCLLGSIARCTGIIITKCRWTKGITEYDVDYGIAILLYYIAIYCKPDEGTYY